MFLRIRIISHASQQREYFTGAQRTGPSLDVGLRRRIPTVSGLLHGLYHVIDCPVVFQAQTLYVSPDSFIQIFFIHGIKTSSHKSETPQCKKNVLTESYEMDMNIYVTMKSKNIIPKRIT